MHFHSGEFTFQAPEQVRQRCLRFGDGFWKLTATKKYGEQTKDKGGENGHLHLGDSRVRLKISEIILLILESKWRRQGMVKDAVSWKS